jgi:hypothetical protein
MRGSIQHAVRHEPTEIQQAFRGLTRARRSKLAKAAHTTLVKADQWARGDGAVKEVAASLEQAVGALAAKKK